MAVFSAVGTGSKLEDHIRARRVAQSAVDTFFLDEKGNVPFARGGQIVGHGAADPRIDAAGWSVGIAPDIPGPPGHPAEGRGCGHPTPF